MDCRGAVVVSELLKLLRAADSNFDVGHTEMTLLDLRLANTHLEAKWLSQGAAPPEAAAAATLGITGSAPSS